ncbi:hypothetical protein IC762_17825 [Bradyrhizobium genosp. L]|uniref:Gp138 family membrane-puncturing spike protein n=1 Tax=Bradyrhizobium genosp. L TaxID=83637 RepID=UPI0018A331E5|nr:Gp138 family membrane-puncturing spike protein [Bradyrhizobium genosp. L]QPF81682.1 hypothetical protein IC762_17825 [Bradyrhizobium genosp. L]
MTDNTASAGSNGAGQQGPNDSAAGINEISFAVDRILARYDFMKPVKVIAVHLSDGTPPAPATVDVQPLVSQVDGNMNAVPEGTVYGIPCQRTQGGPWTIICDPAVGDFGYVISSDRDITKVKASPGVAPPGSQRRFSIADGVYVGGVLNKPGKAYLWLKGDGSLKFADAGGFVIESDGHGNATVTGNVLINGNLQLGGTIQALDGSEYAGNISTLGDVQAGTVSLKNHVHLYQRPTSGATTPTETGAAQAP